VLILGERHLRAILTQYQAHYNTARPQSTDALMTLSADLSDRVALL